MRIFIIAAFCAILSVAGTTAVAKDASASAQFDKAYETLQSADSARDSENVSGAISLYRQALGQYMDLSQRYPSWQSGVIKFRITYCNNQLEALLKKGDVSAAKSGEAADAQDNDAALQVPPIEMPAADAQRNAANVESIKSKAKRLLASGDAKQARSLLLEGLRAEPDNKSLRLMIGMAQCQAGLFTDAVYLLAQLVREEPADAIGHLTFGAACLGLGRIDDATKELKTALDLNPNLAEAHYDLAQLSRLMSPPDMQAVKEQYQKSLDLGGRHDKELDLLIAASTTTVDGAGAAKTKKLQK